MFSLRDYSLEVSDPVIEQRFWEMLPPDSLRYWPIFMSRSPQMNLMLQMTLPVEVETEMTGVGALKTRISYIQPWLRVEWAGALWYLSEDGLMWSQSLLGLKAKNKALWKLPDSFSRYGAKRAEKLPDGVFPAMFSVDDLRMFVDIFENKPWFRDIAEVQVSKRAGEYLLKLSVEVGAQKLSFVGQGKSEKWKNFDVLLSALLPHVKKESGDFVVDMTYSDKIVLAVHEGSAR